MHKGITVSAREAEDEVPQPQLFDYRPSHGPGLCDVKFVLQIALYQAGQRLLINQIALQPAGCGLHVGSDEAQDVCLLPQADIVADAWKVLQRAFGVPLV